MKEKLPYLSPHTGQNGWLFSERQEIGVPWWPGG